MRTEIFNTGNFINHSKSSVRENIKRSVPRSVALSLLIIIALLISCTDGAINAYMDYEPNRAPQILELQSNFSGLPVPGDIITITCKSHDPDGNPLTYTFTSEQGSFTDQVDTGEGNRITFIVGNIRGGEEVTVSVVVTDIKGASAAATLNIGTSSLGPVITLVNPGKRTIGADGYSAVTFRSNMAGFYQVDLADNRIPANEVDLEGHFFFINKNTNTVFHIYGPLYNGDEYMKGIPHLEEGLGNRVLIKVMDGMGQVSSQELLFDVKGTTPLVGIPGIRITDLSKEGMTLNWNLATDLDNPDAGQQQQGMTYSVYISTKDNISTLEEAEINGKILLEWEADRNFFEVKGLNPLTTYYFNVAVKDRDEVKEIYNAVHVTTKEPGSHMLRYDGNGATGGIVPDCARSYMEGEDITVLGNTGNLVRTGYDFSGWNSMPDGNGSNYNQGESFTIGSEDQVLYARWRAGFVTTWKTDNPGESEDNRITIPVYSGESYDYSVDWGDNRSDSHITGSATHTYYNPGIYTVTITGNFPGIYFNNSGDSEKILSIERWGDIEWTSMAHAFFGCKNLMYNATDAPDLTGVTDMRNMFRDAYSFNGDLSSWDVSSVTSMEAMFVNASSFNGNMNNWDVSSVTNMQSMFSCASSFNGDVSRWNVSSVTDMRAMFFHASSFNGNISNWDVSSVTDMSLMFYNTKSFNGDLSKWNVSNVTDMSSMFAVSSFKGDISSWNVSRVTDMQSMFSNSSFNGDISSWDVSSVTNMRFMFFNATSFNRDISGWDVSSVTDMNNMFNYTISFNGNISSWDVSSVRNMSFMFYNASSFDRDISGWDVSSVTSMEHMFSSATSFNGDISGWNVSGVRSMYAMFFNASSFDRDISCWDVSSVTDMHDMFWNATSFNGDISSWDISNVRDMYGMFWSATSFNGDLSGWDVSRVTNMSSMFFRATSFNGDISGWDVSSVTNMRYMFYNASAFSNHDLSGWDVSNVVVHDNFSSGWGTGNTEPRWP